jgi:hypothetical protein
MTSKPEEHIDVFDEEAVHVFSNLISFNLNPEEVCMGMGIRDIKESYRVHIHTYLHMTIPHFLRFAETVSHQVEMLIEKGVISRETEQ